MKHSWSLVALLSLAAFTLTGCSKSPEETAILDTISKMKEVTSVLKGVTDEASAKAAEPKLKSLVADMKKVPETLAKSTDAAEQARLKEKYSKEMDEAMRAFSAEVSRISKDPKLRAATGGITGM